MIETQSLFAPTDGGPHGLQYHAGFVSPNEEQQLIAHIRKLPLQPFQFGAYEGKRQVISFGWRYDHGDRRLKKAQDIPDWLRPFMARIEALANPFAKDRPGGICSVLCTQYDEGAGIGWHRDKPHFGEVFGLSLASACKFRFRRQAATSWERFTLVAEPRSLYVMEGEARNVWEHSIPAVDALRYSITFRTMREPN